MFDSVVVLKSNTRYHIEALISGPPSGRGYNKLGSIVDTVKESVVIFTFSSVNRADSNSTDVKDGQFPEILFSI